MTGKISKLIGSGRPFKGQGLMLDDLKPVKHKRGFMLKTSTYAALRKRAAADLRTLSDVVEDALEAYLRRDK